MEPLVGRALIEIRGSWEGLSGDVSAALSETEAQIAAAEGRIKGAVGATVAEVEASTSAMAGSVAASTAAAAAASEALVGVLGEDANAFVATAAAAGIASEAQGALSSTAAALRETLRGTIIDEARLAEASADVAAGTRTATEGIALMRAESARLAASAKVSAIDTKNLGDESEGTAAKMLTEAQAAQVVAATATELKAQLSALAVVTSAELSRLGEAISFAAGQLKPFSLGLANLGAGVTFGTTAIVEFRDAMALATIQTGQFVLSTEATSAASVAFTAEIQRQIAAQEQLNFTAASRLAMNAAVAQSESEVAAVTAAATREQSALSVATEVSTGSVEINTAAQRRNTEVVGSAVTADRARLAGLSRLAAVVAASTVQTDAEAVALLKALGAKEKDIAATMAELVAAGEWTAALNTQNAAINANAATKKSASAATKQAAESEAMFSGSLGDAAIHFNFLTRTIRNSLFVITGLEAATAAVTIKMAEEQNKLLNLSQQFGIASNEISGFALLSKATGESIDTINTSLRMLQKGFAGVGDGSNLAQKAFAALGIQTAKTGATARDTSSIFSEVADVMALIPDGEQKIAIGTALMGRSFNAVIPLINQGSAGFERMKQASRELGTELTTLELLTGHSIVTAWTDFKGAIQGVGFAIEKELAPSILHAITSTTQWSAKNRELLASDIAGFVRSAGQAFASTVGFIYENINLLKGLTLAIAGATAAYKLMQVQQGLMAASGIGAFLGSTATGFFNLQGAAAAAAGPSGIGAIVGVLGSPLTAVVGVAAASLGIWVLAAERAADAAVQAAAGARELIAELSRLPAPERAVVATQRAFEQSASATKARMDELTASIKHYSEETNDGKEDVSAMKRELEQLTKTYDRQNQLAQEYAQRAKEVGAQESVLTQKAIEESRARENLYDAFKRLQEGRSLELNQIALVEKATGEEVETVQSEFKAKSLSEKASKGFSDALGIEVGVVNKAVAIHGDLGLADDKAGKAAAQAATQIDKFNASAAKATAGEMSKQVDALASELSRLSLPDALDRLPALLNLNAQALDAEVAAIRAETETKLAAAKTDEARKAALAGEEAAIAKATIANEQHAQKLVDTVTHTESAVKITEEYTKTIQSLQQAQDSLKIAVIDDQIKAITDSWKDLDIATRQSQLPTVLALITEKYDAMSVKTEEANQKLIDNAQKTYDSAEAAYALTHSEEDLASMVAALNALWGVTETVQTNAALSAEDLASKLHAEEKAAKDAAAGTNDLAQAQQLAAGMASDLSKALVNLITTGQFKDLGKQLFAQLLDASLIPFVENGLKSILGPSLQSVFGGTSFGQIGSTIGSGISSAVGSVLQPAMLSLSGGLAKSLTEMVSLGVDQAAGGIFSLIESGFGSVAAEGITAALGATGTVAAAVLGVAGIGVAIAAAFGAFEGPTMVQQIARSFSKMIRGSLENDQIREAINSGLQSIGLVLTPGLERIMIETPKKLGAAVYDAWAELGSKSSYQFSEGFFQDMREHGAQLIHSSVADVLNAFYPSITEATTTAIQQSALAAGAAIAREQGIIGAKAVAFANEWAISFIAMAQQTGKSADEILAALQRIAGSGGAVYAALDVINGSIAELGAVAGDFFSILNQDLSQLAGKKIRIGNLDDAMTVLTSLGFDSVTALEYLEGELAKAGIAVEQFGSDWTNVILAVSGDAGGAIRAAGQDMADFGNYSDGTAQIIEQKVVTALGDVVKTAEALGYSAESVQALGTAASLISPELLKSDAVVQALHDSFAQMAVGAHMSIRDLVNSIDPPIPAAVREAIFAVDDLAQSLGALSGAPLHTIKEVADRIVQFAGQMYETIVDENGKATQQLTDFGKQLVNDMVSAIGGMWDTINEDSWVGLDEIAQVFDQLAALPAEAINDPAIQDAMKGLIAKIAEATGDATLVAMANAETITQEMLDQAMAAYDQYKAHIDDNPPEPKAPPPPGSADQPSDSGTTPTGPDTSAATAAPPPAPVPPETVKSWEAITEAAKAYAAAVVEGTTATTALSSEVVTRSAEMLAAIQPLYGTPDDETSLSAINDLLGRVLRQTLDDMTLAIAGATGDWAGSFDYARGAVEMLNTAISEIPTDKTITIHVKQDGSVEGCNCSGDGFALGGIVPGPIGAPTIATVHGGEAIIPAETFSRMLAGQSFSLPPDIASRISSSAIAVPAASAPQAAPALPIAEGWAFVPIREDALIDRALVRLEKDTRSGFAGVTEGGKFRVHPHLRARARRG